MLGRTHIVLAGVTWTAAWWRPPDLPVAAPVVALMEPIALPATLGLVALGAVLPDLDHPRALLASARAGRKGSPLRWLRPFALPAWVLNREFGGHRGALHSLGAAALVAIGFEWTARQVGLFGVGAPVAWGFVSHLLADMATRQGVLLFYPLRIRVGLPGPLAVRTGGLGELLYLVGATVLATAYALGKPP